MINHVVLLAMTEDIDAADAARMEELVEAMRTRIPEVRSYEFVPNVAPGARHNWAILSSFDTPEDVSAYKSAALHQEFVAITDPYTTDFVTLDYEL